MPQLSFIILTWNSEATIGESLASIRNKCGEESLDYEVFVIDNGSQDRTIDILEREMADMPVDFTQLSENHGTTKPRNMALKRATGDVICIMDSDAVLRDGRLSDIIDMLKSDESIGLLGAAAPFPGRRQAGFGKKVPHSIRQVRENPLDHTETALQRA